MGTAAYVVPVAVLSAICGIALIFIWFWYPHAWKKGTRQENDFRAQDNIRDPEKAARDRAVIARALARERGEILPTANIMEDLPPAPAYTYQPPTM